MSDVILESLKEEDIELVRNWRNSEEISQYMYSDEYITPEQQKKWFDSLQVGNDKKAWIIKYKDQKIGLASLYSIKPAFKTAYWAFYIGDPTVRGGGVGAKVEFQVCTYVFEELNYNKLLCEVFVWNEPVIKLHEKFGFRRESYFRDHIIKKGKTLDVVGLAMLKNEWLSIKPSLEAKVYRRKEA